ncbi:hypothetical protein MCOR27_009019 [Pyricularia oryzae]|uniref:Uncharacterized protein n=1 Tax=Pyricularia grisea TaxID=148305 RepID=A0ABQ8N5X7_PYRGI|nr:hypothetical protein MCOR01_007446 [Pyricularia oryzae]KAI6291829.1 hypothetical protein MCOR33_010309 [Pyricularia grisea]KAI6252958.1 hypothetical protein MCOR19_010456 [Pyricularia oryzae]KAI6265246.1 hypothetical protein MCOR26_010843 [Pyricularia oryzae]KAI6271010.1 hypothetical protein MCOR27_009019 [Pyricularia oryzae]
MSSHSSCNRESDSGNNNIINFKNSNNSSGGDAHPDMKMEYRIRIGAVNKQQLIAALDWKLGTDGYIIKVSRFLPQ